MAKNLHFLLFALLISVQSSFGLTIESGTFLPSRNQASTTAAKFTKLTTALQLGDSCSWTAESMRLAFTRAYLNSDLFSLGKWMQRIIKNNQPLCNANQLTVCSKLTQKCVCGEPYLALRLGNLIWFCSYFIILNHSAFTLISIFNAQNAEIWKS